MNRNSLESQRTQAYVDVQEAEKAYLANRNPLTLSRYQEALQTLSRIERRCTILSDIHMPLEMGQ
jgi:hypothetical protein